MFKLNVKYLIVGVVITRLLDLISTFVCFSFLKSHDFGIDLFIYAESNKVISFFVRTFESVYLGVGIYFFLTSAILVLLFWYVSQSFSKTHSFILFSGLGIGLMSSLAAINNFLLVYTQGNLPISQTILHSLALIILLVFLATGIVMSRKNKDFVSLTS